MPSKVQLYAQMADRTAEQITGSYQKWTAFLTTAARLYKYPYNEQLMIFAQRPEATACAEYDLWNKQMRRYVRRGSKGIALVDTSSDQPKLRYVFDVSDTSGGENSRRPYLWEYRQEHREVVSAALEQRFDVSGENGLADQLERVAVQLVDEYWHDNRRDIVGIVDGSFLEDYDEFNIGAAFRNAAVVSTTYALLSRCGMQPGDYFEHEDFLNVFDFNTPQTVAALGTAISQSSELVLRQIEVTIKNYEREKIAERSESHERTDLHPQRGLSDSRPEPDRAAASPAGQVRQDAEGLLEGASSGAVEQPAAVREAVPPSAGDRRGSEQPAGTDDAGADEVGRRDGSAESQRPDEVGRADEHAESAGRGNDPHGVGVQLTMFDAPAGAQMSFFPSEAEQIQSIAEAESVTPSAFSMFISQNDIDHILRAGGNADATRMKIAAEFSKQKPLEDRAAFLKALYHGGNGLITDNGRFSAWYGDDGIHIATGDTSRYLRSAQVIGWADAAERIEELLDGGTFATNLEVTEAPRYERLGIAVDVWNLYHDFSDEAKSLGYLSCLGNIHSTSFPEETERLTDDLLNPEFRERLLAEHRVFLDAYRENRELLRFHFHRPQALLTRMEDLSLPRKEYHSDMAAVPKTGRFITEDEIAASLANGSGFEGGKTRIHEFFQTPHTTKESADFLKKEYGIGGRTHAVSRESGSYEDHGSKGIVLKKNGCADIQMNWNKVASRISELVRLNRYLTPDEQAAYDKEMAQDAMRNAVYNDYNDVKAAHPDEIVLYQVGDFFELYGEDARAVADDLSLELTRRNLEGVGRVTMCGFPAKDLEKYIEKLREKNDVTISRIGDETFETPRYLRGQIEISYVPYTAEWQVSRKSMVRYNDVAAFTTYGTDRASAYRLLEDALNLRDIRIYDTIEDADGRERRVLNAKETTLAAQKQQLIRDAFKDWIWKDPERRETLVRQYNEEMNSTRPREYDGSHIVFSGMNPEITLREHQKNAIAHVLYGGNTLLAHEVGAGKTFEMVASAMESKRLGLCQKSIFVVPNHLTEQWASEFLRLYPSANILVTTKKDFETHNRKKFCARIATGDYDAVIIGHSQFERIPISPERQERLLHQQIEEITDGIQDTKLAGGNSFTIKSLERTKKGLEARLKKLQASDRKDDVIYFEQLGVDRMFVDESDNYKNLFLYTKMRNVAGLSTTDAQKSSDMFSKCRYMDELTGGRGVVFATGTPVSNSMTELYTIQRYLQHDRLQEMGMGHFDCWASRFGETTTALELAPEGTGYRARTRFAKFFNLPELMNLFKEVADIKTADQLHLPTPEVAYHTIATKPTQIQQDMVKALSERASKVHSGAVSPDVDNMLKITSDGRKLGLDQRIINPMLPDEETTKVNQCVANILQYWRDGEEEKLTQLVFCDISTPKTTPSQRAAKASPGTLDSPEIHALESAISLEESSDTPFTVYEDVRQKLIAAGMPPEQIAFIHDANTEVKKRELFAKVRSGQVRVLMGSTAKMGAGTNVQDRLVALHDLDCPWRPRDLTQRKGRIERQGNQNKLVHVCRYVTEGTFDAYLWQTVENKQKFISQIMTSKSPVRSCEDVDATALSFAEIKALCAGDPRIKERMDLDIEVSKLKIMKADHNSKQFRLEDSLLKYFPEKIEEHKGFVRGLEADMQTLAVHPLPAEGFVGMEIRGDRLTDKENAGAALLDTCKEVKGNDPVQIGTYRGFTMSVAFDSMWKTYTLTLKGRMTHRVELGSDARGNLVRIENALDKMPERLRSVQEQLENLYNQQAAAKAEVGKPFPQEQELAAKTARLIELDMELNLDGKGQPQPEQAIAKSARPSVLDRLKASPVHGAPEKPHKKEMEAR